MAEFINIDGELTPVNKKLNPKRIIDATRFTQIETADLYGGYVTGLTFSAKEGGVYKGKKLIEAAGGKDSVKLETKGTSDGIGSGETFVIDFAGADYTGEQSRTGVVDKFNIKNRGTGYKSGVTYIANSQSGRGTGFQFKLIVGDNGKIEGISNVISYGQNYLPYGESQEFIPITGGPGSGGLIVIEGVRDFEGTEIVYQTYAIRNIFAIPDSRIERTEEDEKFRSNYHVGQQITINPEQWGEEITQFPVTFERLDNTEDVDIISPEISLARSSDGQGLYNSVKEMGYDSKISPDGTVWNSYYIDSEPGMYGFADLSNVSNRKYGTFREALWNQVGNYILNTELVMHDQSTGLYWMFEFHNWTRGEVGGGFAYTRTLITDKKYAESTFTKKDYGDEVDTFSQYLSLTRGNNRGIFNLNELSSYDYFGGASHLWMSEPIPESFSQARLEIKFDIRFFPETIAQWKKDGLTLNDFDLQFRGKRITEEGMLQNQQTKQAVYSVTQRGLDIISITLSNFFLDIEGYNTWELDGLTEQEQGNILGQSIIDELFERGQITGLERDSSWFETTIQLINRRTGGDRLYGEVYANSNRFIEGGKVKGSFIYRPSDRRKGFDITFKQIAFLKENLYLTFNPNDIDIKYLKENITLDTIKSEPLSWYDFQMVPWQIVHNSNPPKMVDKEMIMLDVEAGRFYRIKFLEWTQGGGGGFSYIKSDISISQTVIATVTDVAYDLVNSFERPLKNVFSLKILFDRFTKQHFVRVTNEDGSVIDHDFDGNDYVPTELPPETEYVGYTIEDDGDGITKVKFEWTNDISSTDEFSVSVDDTVFTIQDQYVENGKLVVELSAEKVYYWFFGDNAKRSFIASGAGPSNQWNGLSEISFSNDAFTDSNTSGSKDISSDLKDVDTGWRIEMTNLTSGGNYATYEIAGVKRNTSPSYQFFYIKPISGSGFFDFDNNHLWSFRFYSSGPVSAIPAFREFNFNISSYDKLGNRIEKTAPVYEKKEDFSSLDLISGFYKTDPELNYPYFIDESYHAVIYSAEELRYMYTTDGEYVKFTKGNIITEIGFPFYIGAGPGDSLKDEDVEGGFSLVAKIYHTKLKEIDEDYVKNNWIIDDEFNPKILDKNSTVTDQVRIGSNDEIRYVYFPIEDFVWDGESNILIIYYMDGQTERGGWNGAFKSVWSNSLEEYLGFNKDNGWIGRRSPRSKAKVDLSFTTNDTRNL
jgi:hypothetical protein